MKKVAEKLDRKHGIGKEGRGVESFMSRDELIGRFESLPPEGRQRVVDFIARLSELYGRSQGGSGGTDRRPSESFIGMWADREHMTDSSEWVRSARQRE